MLFAVFLFILSALIIFFAGTRLADYGDQISKITGLGGIWIGTLLIAFVTSLPEVSAVISAALLKNPDIIMGDLAGANCFNLLTLATADIYARSGALLSLISSLHLFTGMLSMFLMIIAAFFIRFAIPDALFNVSLGSFLIVFIYFLFFYRIFWLENIVFKKEVEQVSENHTRSRHVYLFFTLASLAVIVSGFTISYSADLISKLSGLSSTFIGSVFVGLSTALPEMTVALSSVRIKAYNIAAGTLLGSNAFNMTILFLADIFYHQPIFLAVSRATLTTLLLAIVLTALVVFGIQTRIKLSFYRISIFSYLIIATFLIGLFFVYRGGLAF